MSGDLNKMTIENNNYRKVINTTNHQQLVLMSLKNYGQSNQKNQPNTPQQSETMTPEEAEKLLRAAPDDRKSMTPIYRGEHMPPKSVDQDW